MEIPYVSKNRPDTGLYNAKLGIWLFLASQVMLFGALFSAYILLRVGADSGTWPHGLLSVPLGTINTLVLIGSSVTVVLSWAALKMNQFGRYKFYQAITILCALIFMGIKTVEYRSKFTHYTVQLQDGTKMDGHIDGSPMFLNLSKLQAKNVEEIKFHPDAPKSEKNAPHPEPQVIKTADIKSLQSWGPWHSTYLAIYFTLTGLHALHVLGGAFVIFMIWGPLSGMWKTDPTRYTNRVEVSGLFWHFVDLVWIFLFPVLYLL